MGGNNIYFGRKLRPIYANILHNVVTLVVKHQIIYINEYETTTQKLIYIETGLLLIPRAAIVPPYAEADLEKMVNETCDLCLRMRMTQDPSVTQLLKGGIGDHINMSQDQFNHWISVARRLLMQPIQIATLLQMRQATLKLLSDVYAKRELLNEDLALLCAQGRAVRRCRLTSA